MVAFASMHQPTQLGLRSLRVREAQAAVARISASAAVAFREQCLRERAALPRHHLAQAAEAVVLVSFQMPTAQATEQTQALVALAQLALSSSRMWAKENKCATPS